MAVPIAAPAAMPSTIPAFWLIALLCFLSGVAARIPWIGAGCPVATGSAPLERVASAATAAVEQSRDAMAPRPAAYFPRVITVSIGCGDTLPLWIQLRDSRSTFRPHTRHAFAKRPFHQPSRLHNGRAPGREK